MPGKKFYAVVFKSGKHEIHETTWEKFEPIVKGAKGASQKSFTTREEADGWVVKTKEDINQSSKTRAKIKKIEEKNELTHNEWMSTQVNTPHWNAVRKSRKKISDS